YGVGVGRRDLGVAYREREGEFLPDIAQIEMDLSLRARFMAQARAPFRDHLAMDLAQRREVEGREVAIEGADEIVPLVRQQHAERREVRGKQRHHDLRDMKLA